MTFFMDIDIEGVLHKNQCRIYTFILNSGDHLRVPAGTVSDCSSLSVYPLSQNIIQSSKIIRATVHISTSRTSFQVQDRCVRT